MLQSTSSANTRWGWFRWAPITSWQTHSQISHGRTRSTGQATSIESATAVVVTKGQLVGNVDIQVPRQAFLTGTVLDAATSQPIAGLDLDVLDPQGGLLPQYDASTLEDGTYRIGPIPPGSYLLRADATNTDPWVDQYQPGVFSMADAVPILVGSDVIDGLDFSLGRGGWIRGTVTRESDGSVMPGMDLDVFLSDGTPIPSVDADTDATGAYRIGSLPTGLYLIRADPTAGSGLAATYWNGAQQPADATAVQVLVGLDTTGIDIALVVASQGDGPWSLPLIPTPSPIVPVCA